MSVQNINKKELRDLIKEVIQVNPSLIKDALVEVLKDDANDSRSDELKQIVKNHFDKFGEVFKALA